jgi:hypothetical protein
VELKDGKTEKVGRGCNNSRVESQSTSLGTVSGSSQESWFDEISAGGEDSSRRNSIRELASNGNPDFGKILERLHRIEQKHIAYVKTHQEHLKAQLEESAVSETEFLQEVKDLENSLLELIENQPDVQ